MTEPALNDDRYAVMQIAIGPLPEGVTWDHPDLERMSDLIEDAVADVKAPGGEGDVSISGRIQAMLPGAVLNWGQDDDLTWNEQRAWTGLGHYHSTYCLHGKHDECRTTKGEGCKHCAAPCNCECHPKVPAP